MMPTATMYNLPPFSDQTMAENAPSPAEKPMKERPVFLILAVVVAVILLVMAGRYGWKRIRG